MRTTVSVTINITDINDNSPVFPVPDIFRFHVSKRSPIGTVVGHVFAYDVDEGPNGYSTYSYSQKGGNLFIVDSNRSIQTSTEINKVVGDQFNLETPQISPSEVPTTCNGPSIDTNKSDQIKETTPDLHTCISSNDIGFVKQSTCKLTNEEKFYLIRNHFQPRINYNFPTKKYAGKNRLFQLNWLNRYDGLVYSPSQEGAYCIYCALFGVDSFGTLSCKPLTNMAHASTRLNDHFARDEKSCKKSHTEARAKAQPFLDNIEQRTTDIQTFIDKAMNEHILLKANRTVLKSICKCVLLCGKQNCFEIYMQVCFALWQTESSYKGP
ncbi:Hypothetical predicted protein [Mytilus galloprovincialis]|uniref:Cadherin domain-containing protein n=1 Tax=Mytilus galloprovincialis TaxID=29158 RepID=A0A8B6E989_MYTGA|nr:Hypothetical predicted protein [Mytilus galloprovincialis]